MRSAPADRGRAKWRRRIAPVCLALSAWAPVALIALTALGDRLGFAAAVLRQRPAHIVIDFLEASLRTPANIAFISLTGLDEFSLRRHGRQSFPFTGFTTEARRLGSITEHRGITHEGFLKTAAHFSHAALYQQLRFSDVNTRHCMQRAAIPWVKRNSNPRQSIGGIVWGRAIGKTYGGAPGRPNRSHYTGGIAYGTGRPYRTCTGQEHSRARMHRRLIIAFAAVAIWTLGTARAWALEPASVNDASFGRGTAKKSTGFDPLLVKAQVLLDRARFSPGEIDGRPGGNARKAIDEFARARGLHGNGRARWGVWSELAATSSEPVLTEYTIDEKDVQGPFLKRLPSKMEAMKDLDRLAYSSPVEALAEKFHMSEALLKALNPGKSLERSGERIFVANVAPRHQPAR